MTKEQIINMMNEHPIFQLATCDGKVPRVRHMMLYRADDDGLFFHSAFEKDVCSQILDNNNVELCFCDIKTFLQIRVSGNAIVVHDIKMKAELLSHPSREYLRNLRSLIGKEEFDENFVVFRVINSKATVWSIENNYNEMRYDDKEYIEIW